MDLDPLQCRWPRSSWPIFTYRVFSIQIKYTTKPNDNYIVIITMDLFTIIIFVSPPDFELVVSSSWYLVTRIPSRVKQRRALMQNICLYCHARSAQVELVESYTYANRSSVIISESVE